MRLNGAGILAVFASGTMVFAATGVWQSKDFRNWTDDDARSVMTDSPWAKPMPMPAGGRPGMVVIEPGANNAPPPSASLGNPSNTTSGANMAVGANPGSAGPADPSGTHNLPTTPSLSAVSGNTGAPAPQSRLTIIWASAMPVRLAVLKLRSAANMPTDEQVANVTRPRPNYVIAVVGLPAPEGGSDPKALASSAFLTVRGKSALVANDSSYRRIGNSDVYFFHFTRASLPITAADQQVEFKMTAGNMEIKRKFELKEMQYQGELAL
ncbi:MAG: hypothetical protein JOZ48_19020 [Acidobacteriaceae bacterium]|nr:hypothetical protein [Acidobacteriaceae bacterium]